MQRRNNIPARPVAFKRKARSSRPNQSSRVNREGRLRTAMVLQPLRPIRDSRNLRAPVAQTQIIRTADPKFTRQPNGDILITHRELIMDVLGSVAFRAIKIPVNPGLQSFTTWLSQIAPNYESYRFDKLDFEFKTTTSTTATGVVMAAVDYDASDSPPVDKQTLAAYKGYSRSSPWENFRQISIHENLNKRSSYYVRTGALASNEDIKLYDVGNLFLATQGQAADDTPIGEIYVDYTVRLMTPQLTNPALGTSKSAFFQKVDDETTTAAGSNAPLIISTGALPGATTITATSPYQCIMSIGMRYSSGGGAPAVGGSATIGEIVNAISATVVTYDAEVSFLAGQTVVINYGGTTANLEKLWVRVGQYNNALAMTPTSF